MFQNNWISQQLVNQHQRQLQEKADQARQAHNAQHATNTRRHRRMIAKLRTEMTTL